MGAQNIIFSLWPVFSDTTTEMMISFYGRLLEGYGIAEAMRYARERVHKMIENDEGLWFFKDFPLLSWAPFSFIGFPFFAYQKEVVK
jgi:CHAT domain-containing protein